MKTAELLQELFTFKQDFTDPETGVFKKPAPAPPKRTWFNELQETNQRLVQENKKVKAELNALKKAPSSTEPELKELRDQAAQQRLKATRAEHLAVAAERQIEALQAEIADLKEQFALRILKR